jgi:lactoylglutathione lyase
MTNGPGRRRARGQAPARSASAITAPAAWDNPGPEVKPMRYLHTMVRVRDLEASLRFYRDALGLEEVRRKDNAHGRYTLVFLAAPGQADVAELELTYNWDDEDYGGARNFGHLAYEVDDIHATCERLAASGVAINRPPRDGRMAFVRSPDGISIELLQRGGAVAAREPWASMPNTGSW